jgi:hypothetical protein
MKCIFCGFRTLKYDGALEELKTHSATCPQHPAVIALSEAREREGRLQALLQEIADNDEASLTELESMGFAQIVDRTLYDKIRAALTEPTRAGETQAQDEYEPPFGVARFPVRIPAAQPQGERTDTELAFILGVDWCAKQLEQYEAVDCADENRREGHYAISTPSGDAPFVYDSKYDAWEAFESFEKFLKAEAKDWRESAPRFMDKALRASQDEGVR